MDFLKDTIQDKQHALVKHYIELILLRLSLLAIYIFYVLYFKNLVESWSKYMQISIFTNKQIVIKLHGKIGNTYSLIVTINTVAALL